MPEPITAALLFAAFGAAGFVGRQIRKHAQGQASAAAQHLARARHFAARMEQRAHQRGFRLVAERTAAISWLYDRSRQAFLSAGLAPPGGLAGLGHGWHNSPRWRQALADLHSLVVGKGPVDKCLNAMILGSALAQLLRDHLPSPAGLPDGALDPGLAGDAPVDWAVGVAGEGAADWTTDLPLEEAAQALDFVGGFLAPLSVLRIGRYLYQAQKLHAQVPHLQNSARAAAQHTRQVARLCTRLRRREQAEEEAAYAVYAAAMRLEGLQRQPDSETRDGSRASATAAAAAHLDFATRAWWRLVNEPAAPASAAAGGQPAP